MISVEHLMEIQERLHDGENIDDVFNDVYELGRADKYKEIISENMLLTEKQVADIRADVIEELFNTEIINGMTLKDIYEEAPINEFDEGWNRCYEDFVEVAEQLKEQK